MAFLNRDAILTAHDLKTKVVAVPELGGEVIVSEMGGLALAEFYEEIDKAKQDAGGLKQNLRFMATVAVFCVVGEDGKPLFTMADRDALARKKMKTLATIFEAADELNLLSKPKGDEAGKNSVSGEEDGSSSSSPES